MSIIYDHDRSYPRQPQGIALELVSLDGQKLHGLGLDLFQL